MRVGRIIIGAAAGLVVAAAGWLGFEEMKKRKSKKSKKETSKTEAVQAQIEQSIQETENKIIELKEAYGIVTENEEDFDPMSVDVTID